MKRLPQNISLLAVSVFTVGVVAAAPVSARNGVEDTDTVTTTSVEDSSAAETSNSGSVRDAKRVRTASEDSATHVGDDSDEDKPTTEMSELKERAAKLLAAERHDKKGKSVEQRQKSCEARKESLVKRGTNYGRNASKHLEVFNSIYAKVQAFQDKKKLDVGNYDALKADVDAKKATAEAAVKALNEFDVSIDCSAQDPAASVATLKTTVSNTRNALHEYRLAIKNLVVALENAAGTDDTTDTTEAN